MRGPRVRAGGIYSTAVHLETHRVHPQLRGDVSEMHL